MLFRDTERFVTGQLYYKTNKQKMALNGVDVEQFVPFRDGQPQRSGVACRPELLSRLDPLVKVIGRWGFNQNAYVPRKKNLD